MSVSKTEAISLGRTDYSDSSQIITFYTRDYGKIHTIAKGFKRSSGRHSSRAIDLLTRYQILFIKKQHTQLHTLTEAVLQDNYQSLRNNLDRYYKAAYTAELVNEFTEEGDPCAQLFEVFLNTIEGITADVDATLRMLVFEIKILRMAGYLPEWKECVNCRKSIQHLPNVHFSAKEGGVLCKACQGRHRNSIVVSVGAVLIAGRLAELNLQRLERVKIQLPICIEIEKMLRYYISSVLNKKLNSWKYIKLDSPSGGFADTSPAPRSGLTPSGGG